MDASSHIVGFAAVLFDLALDPLAIRLVFPTVERTIGRWTWFMGPSDVGIYGEPVFSFSGWMLICGYAAAMLQLGRWWHRRSGESRAVGIAYPALAMIPALGLAVSPPLAFSPVAGADLRRCWTMSAASTPKSCGDFCEAAPQSLMYG